MTPESGGQARKPKKNARETVLVRRSAVVRSHGRSTAMPTSEHVILRELLARDPNWVSGTALAAKLGVSRVAVWQHMEKLRAAGFAFEAQRARGYRITARPSTLYVPFIETQLKVRPRHFSLLVL